MRTAAIISFLLSTVGLYAAPDYWVGANGTDMATVGDAGNSAYSSDTSLYNGYGSVSYEYSISKTEVTVSQYLNFINSFGSNAYINSENSNIVVETPIGNVDVYSGLTHYPNVISYNNISGKYEAINSQGSTPITYVSAIAGALYANWLSNGADSNADCLVGVYDFKTYGFTADALKNADRSSGGYMLCSLDEWIKAGYYSPELNEGNGGYYGFATQSNTPPTASMPTSDANAANFASKNYNGEAHSNFTSVGSYPNSASYYGVLDQEGNASEWTDTIYPEGGILSMPEGVVIGGICATTSAGENVGINVDLFLNGNDADSSDVWTGIRIAYRDVIPEPSACAAILGIFAWLFLRCSRKNG